MERVGGFWHEAQGGQPGGDAPTIGLIDPRDTRGRVHDGGVTPAGERGFRWGELTDHDRGHVVWVAAGEFGVNVGVFLAVVTDQ